MTPIRYLIAHGDEPLIAHDSLTEAWQALDTCDAGGCAEGLSIVIEEVRRTVLYTHQRSINDERHHP